MSSRMVLVYLVFAEKGEEIIQLSLPFSGGADTSSPCLGESGGVCSIIPIPSIGLGDMSFAGESEPRGKGMFAACSVRSSSTQVAACLRLASRDFRGLDEDLAIALSCRYGWCLYHALPEVVPLQP